MYRLSGIVLMLVMLFMVLLGGCSNSGEMVTPGQEPTLRETDEGIASHSPWGLWQFVADPEKKTLDVMMLRTGAMHVNVLPFLDQPPYVYLTIESVQFNGDMIDVDIGLRHPFLGLNRFTGFDVKGIFITNGSFNSFTDSDLVMATEGDTRLLNPDGYSRWWNPAEFPHTSTMFGYMDGALGAPDSFADYNCTMNGYKYFCDDLTEPDALLSDINPAGRGVFSAGQKNVRHYSIELGTDGLVFNYAVDASWQFPQGDPPWVVPDSFGPNANQPEAYRIEVSETAKTLYYDEVEQIGGGDVSLSIDTYDWFNAEMNTIKVEWPGFASQVISTGTTGGGTGYSTYEIDLVSCTPSAIGDQPLLITVESDVAGYGDVIPGAPVASYFIYNVNVPSGSGSQDPPDICTGWGAETGMFNPSGLLNANSQMNLASDSSGNVWMWSQWCGNSTARSTTAFNGDWNTMWRKSSDGHFGYSHSDYVDVSLTPAYDGTLVVGLSPREATTWEHSLSIAWWDGSHWWENSSEGWLIYQVLTVDQVARRINGYRDSTGRFHAFMLVNNQLLDYYGDSWQAAWSNVTVAPMPYPGYGATDGCHTRTDFVAETSDGYIYLTWTDSGVKVGRCLAGTTSWQVIDVSDNGSYDSPTIFVDNQDRIFVAARYRVSEAEDEIHFFKSTDGLSFGEAQVIFSETDMRVDPCYLTLKGDSDDQLFLCFPYRAPSEASRIAIIAGNAGGEEWTDVCILTDTYRKYPAMAVRPNGSIEVCYGYCTYPYDGIDEGVNNKMTSERNELWGRSHPGFVE